MAAGASGIRKSSVTLLKRSLSDVIQCAICIGPPRDPRSLPCLHTYCQSCLETFYNRCVEKKSVPVNRIKCPECQKISDLPPGGISKLPADFRIKQIEVIFNDILGKCESEISSDSSDISRSTSRTGTSGHVYDNIDMIIGNLKGNSSQTKNGLKTKIGISSSDKKPVDQTSLSNPLYQEVIIPLTRNDTKQPEILSTGSEKTQADRQALSSPVYGNVIKPQATNGMKVSGSQSANDGGAITSAPQSATYSCTDDMARNLHVLIERSPTGAKDYLRELTVSERKVVVSKLMAGESALCVAFQQQAYDLMVFLVERCHADVNQIILGQAADGRFIESTLLIQVAASKDLTAAQVLVSHGANVNQADGEGITPLFVACLEGSLKMVEYLIDVGANVNYNGNKYGASPLMAASTIGHVPIIKCLINKGAEVNRAQKNGYTPLMAACQKAPEPELVAAFLLTHWADINAQDANGYTPLMYAVRRASLDTVELLLMNKAHVNVKDALGQTVLHQAVALSSLVIVRLLVKRGADPHVKDRHGKSPLDLASHNPDITAALKTFRKINRKK